MALATIQGAVFVSLDKVRERRPPGTFGAFCENPVQGQPPGEDAALAGVPHRSQGGLRSFFSQVQLRFL